MKTVLVIIVAFSVLNAMKFKFDVPSNEKICFDESLPIHTIISGEATSDREFTFGITDNDDHLLLSQLNVKETVFSVSTTSSNKYSICTFNPNKEVILINFTYKKGMESKDLSHLPQKKTLSRIDEKLNNIDEVLEFISADIKGEVEDAEEKINASQSVASNIMLSSIVCIAIMVLLAVFQNFYLKRYFRIKKLT